MTVHHFVRRVWFASAVCLAFTACDDVVTVEAPIEDPFASGDPVLGGVAFAANCSQCHASRDGFDLAHFSFDASTILRRAVAHVDTAMAMDIVAHVRTLDGGGADRNERPFQPGGVVLQDDREFAVSLFGADRWPSDLTADQLRAIDPRETPVALSFPKWSVEANNLDWMPDGPIAGDLLDWNAGLARRRLGEFYRTQSMQDLVNAVQAIRVAERATDHTTAPCVMNPIERLQPGPCFETRRWAATLGAQYMLRYGIDTPVHSVLHDAWWDVGFAVRRTVLRDGHFEHGESNWVTWMWLGWSFEPDRHASVYLAQGLERIDRKRHAAFHALRAQVARPANSLAVFQDARTAARFSPDAWTYDVTRFALGHALQRLEAGERPSDRVRAATEVRGAYNASVPHVTDAQKAELLAHRDLIIDLLAM